MAFGELSATISGGTTSPPSSVPCSDGQSMSTYSHLINQDTVQFFLSIKFVVGNTGNFEILEGVPCISASRIYAAQSFTKFCIHAWAYTRNLQYVYVNLINQDYMKDKIMTPKVFFKLPRFPIFFSKCNRLQANDRRETLCRGGRPEHAWARGLETPATGDTFYALVGQQQVAL